MTRHLLLMAATVAATTARRRSAVRRKQTCPICDVEFRPTRCEQRTCGLPCSIILRRNEGTLGRPYAAFKACSAEGCERKVKSRDLCDYHYHLEPDQMASIRAKHLRSAYGMTVEDRDEMLARQGGKCAICRSSEPRSKRGWHTDHDHETGAVRGVLCLRCNVRLGMVEKDPSRVKDREFVAAALQYLAAHAALVTA